ncbi:MAG: hypothetical protein Tsb0014_42430 [Pleurocapsa sp.]
MKRQPSQETTFFRLTPGVRDRLLEINLTAAEWRIWCYLVSLDPFGDRGAKFVPAELMLKCSIKKTTYFSAKAKFQKLGLFDFRDGVTKVVNLQTSLEQTTSGDSQQAVTIESEISESEFGNSESHSEISESEFGNSEYRSLKPIPSKASRTPQTIQIYIDFKRSLSESERENFFKFVEEKIKNLEKPINDLEAWLASKNAAHQNRWEVYYQKFQIEGKDNLTQREKLTAKQRAIANFQNRHNLKNPENQVENPENRQEHQNQPIEEGRARREADLFEIAEVTKLNNGSKEKIEAENTQNDVNKAENSALDQLEAKQRAISEFQKKMKINQSVTKPEPEEINSEEYQRSLAAFDELLSSALGEKKPSLAQQYREKMALSRQQQQDLARQRKEAAEERAKQQEPDLQERKERILREIEEFNLRQLSKNPEITSQNSENE